MLSDIAISIAETAIGVCWVVLVLFMVCDVAYRMSIKPEK